MLQFLLPSSVRIQRWLPFTSSAGKCLGENGAEIVSAYETKGHPARLKTKFRTARYVTRRSPSITFVISSAILASSALSSISHSVSSSKSRLSPNNISESLWRGERGSERPPVTWIISFDIRLRIRGLTRKLIYGNQKVGRRITIGLGRDLHSESPKSGHYDVTVPVFLRQEVLPFPMGGVADGWNTSIKKQQQTIQ